MSSYDIARREGAPARLGLGLAALGAGLAASALFNNRAARRAEAENPPEGSFLEINDVRLHRLDTGGNLPAVVYLHGNGATSADVEVSGLLAALRGRHRVIAFDRPGFGYSERPGDNVWTPERQADLIVTALDRLGVDRFALVGHSFGGLVALALALRHPHRVSRLVPVGAYAFPTPRLDAALMAAPAVPGLGHVLRHTLSPLLTRAFLPRFATRIFAPRPVPDRFWRDFPVAFTYRPGQLTASAEESAMMITGAARLAPHYGALDMPTEVIAGADDRMVSSRQSRMLAEAIPGAGLTLVPRTGHMVHWFVPELVAEKVNGAAASDRSEERARERVS